MDLFKALNNEMLQYNRRLRKTKPSPKMEMLQKLSEKEHKSLHAAQLRYSIMTDYKSLVELVGEAEAKELLNLLTNKPF